MRHAGFSYHDSPELLDQILTKHPEMEFVQLQINYLDWESPWIQSRACYEVARRHNKPVIVMEPGQGRGTLAQVPPEAQRLFREREPSLSPASWAIRFAASLPGVMMVLSGMSSLSQMEDNLSYMEDFQPLTQEEQQLCFQAAEIINSQIAIPCTGCSYCTEGCPQRIAIPSISPCTTRTCGRWPPRAGPSTSPTTTPWPTALAGPRTVLPAASAKAYVPSTCPS